MVSAAELLQRAVELHRAGRVADAEPLYRQVLVLQPAHGDAKYFLGVAAMQSGRLEDAAKLLESACALEPDKAAFHLSLGQVYHQQGKAELAVAAYASALALKADLADAHFNLGLVLDHAGAVDAAMACYGRAVELRPADPRFTKRLAEVGQLRQLGGGDAQSLGRGGSLCFVVAQTFLDLEQVDEAAAWYERAVRVTPPSAEAHCSLGTLRAMLGRLDAADESFRRAIEIDPAFALAYLHRAAVLADSGSVHEGIASSRQAVALRPHQLAWHSYLLYDMPFDLECDADSILAEAKRWNQRHAKPFAGQVTHKNDRSNERPLRIGYVSPNFFQHCQSFFTTPLFEHHDRAQFKIYCYSSTTARDECTERLGRSVDVWRDVSDLDDEKLARAIRADKIDILVDLTMHMDKGRLLVFARKPAPVQICWLAYPGTTGLAAMDYRITDRFLDPPEVGAGPYTERPLRLPDTFWCYDPLANEPEVGELPALKRGSITFGCLNNFKKINKFTLELWARVLARVPKSRLLLRAPAGSARARVIEIFERGGVEANRIEFLSRVSRDEYLATYLNIDVCLDTYPYNGHTTSLDALWMGVPVVTLVGPTAVGRAGLCQAHNLDLPELIASSPDEFVLAAEQLTADWHRLSDLRQTLRARMNKSPLMDAPRFARNIEAAYRQAWNAWCATSRGK